jgi:hypothetical protein
MIDFKFNHNKNNILDACGTTEEKVEALFDKINEVGNTCTSASEAIEKIGETFTSTELAFVLNHVQVQVRMDEELEENPVEIIKHLVMAAKGEA